MIPPTAANQTLREGLRVLEALAADGGDVGLSELARTLGLAKSQTHRLLRSLCGAGYVVQSPDRRYRSDIKVLRLTSAVISAHPLRRVALPVMRRLAASTRCPAVLSVLHEDVALVLASEQPSRRSGEEAFDVLGRVAGLHASANGKALLAWQPKPRRDALIATIPLPALTARTASTRSALAAVIERTRADGYAVNDRELAPNHASIALPLIDGFARCHAALGLSYRPGSRTAAEVLPALRRAVADIGRLLFPDRELSGS